VTICLCKGMRSAGLVRSKGFIRRFLKYVRLDHGLMMMNRISSHFVSLIVCCWRMYIDLDTTVMNCLKVIFIVLSVLPSVGVALTARDSNLRSARLYYATCNIRRSQWSCGLRRGFAAIRLLGLRVRIPPRAWMFVLGVVSKDKRQNSGPWRQVRMKHRVEENTKKKKKSRRGRGCFVFSECCVLAGRGLCDGPIPFPGESYRLWYV
jgi:hypothetical protein